MENIKSEPTVEPPIKVMDLIQKFNASPHVQLHRSLTSGGISYKYAPRRKTLGWESPLLRTSESPETPEQRHHKSAQSSRKNSLIKESKIPVPISSSASMLNKESVFKAKDERERDLIEKSMMIKSELESKCDKNGTTKHSHVFQRSSSEFISPNKALYESSPGNGFKKSTGTLHNSRFIKATSRCTLNGNRSESPPMSIKIISSQPNLSMESSISSELRTVDDEKKAIRERMIEEVGYTIHELHQVEQQYIDTLRIGIQNYILPFEDKHHEMPAELLGQKYHIFRNMEHIADFHENKFFPALRECDTNVIRLGETIAWFLKTNQFYPYVLYAVNNNRARKLVQKNMNYFQERQSELKDKLGVNSFLLQPIQRLPRYQLLLLQLIKQLGKCLPDKWVRDQIALCSQAEIQMQHMLNRVNASLSLNDFEVDDDDLQILHLGAFHQAFMLDIFDHHSSRHFKSKIFLLEKGLVITALMAKMELQFKQFIPHSQLAVREINEFRLDVFDLQMPTRSLSITSDYANVAELRHRLKKYLVDDDAEAKTSTLSRKNPWFRSQKSRLNLEAIGADVDSKGDKKCKTLKRQESCFTFWYHDHDGFQRGIGPTLQRLVNAEKNYINMLDQLISLFSLASPQTRPIIIDTQLHNVYMLRRYHKDLFEQLVRAAGNIAAIYDAYFGWIERTTVPNQMYAANCASVFEALCMIPGFVAGDEEVRDHMHFPHAHIERQRAYLRQVKAEIPEGVDVPKVKVCNGVESKLYESAVLVKDNLMLNLLKASMYSTFGRVIHSEPVTMDDVAHRLLVMQNGLACVKTTVAKGCDQVSVDQEFAGLVFAIPFTEVSVKERPKLKSLEFVLNGKDLRKVYFVSSTKRHDMKKLIKRMVKAKPRSGSFQCDDTLT